MKLKQVIFTFIITVFFLEILLRLFGFGPYSYNSKWPEINMQPDSLLGFSHNIGTMSYNLYGKDITETIFKDRNRITRPRLDTFNRYQYKINLYGCSFTHGYGIEDSLTYPYILQKLRNEKINNFGISAHGLLQFYLLLKEHSMNNLKPNIAIIHYASFHNNRNILTKLKQIEMERYSSNKAKLDSISFPYMKLNNDNVLEIYYEKHKKYKETPLIKYSAIINSIDKLIVYIEDYKTNKNEALTNQILMKKIINLCKEQHITLIVLGLTNDKITKAMLKLCQDNDIYSQDISKGLDTQEYKLSQNDNHPNAKACQVYASRVNEILDYVINK